jgi:hypothetical protein
MRMEANCRYFIATLKGSSFLRRHWRLLDIGFMRVDLKGLQPVALEFLCIQYALKLTGRTAAAIQT